MELMDVQENIDVLTLDSEEVEDVTSPVHFVTDYLFEELLDVLECLLG